MKFFDLISEFGRKLKPKLIHLLFILFSLVIAVGLFLSLGMVFLVTLLLNFQITFTFVIGVFALYFSIISLVFSYARLNEKEREKLTKIGANLLWQFISIIILIGLASISFLIVHFQIIPAPGDISTLPGFEDFNSWREFQEPLLAMAIIAYIFFFVFEFLKEMLRLCIILADNVKN